MNALTRILDRPRVVFAILAAVYMAGAVGTALTERPWCDEGWFASPALNLASAGYMGTDVIETANTHLAGIRERTYWIFPFYPVALAGWIKLLGFSLFKVRLLSVAAGAAILLSIGLIVRRLGLDWRVAAIATALLVVDYQFLRRASEGRMDALCAALGFGAIAVYLSWRETHYRRAILAAHALCAAAIVTHPNGGLYFLTLALAQIYFDRQRIRWPDFLVAAAPYVVALGVWSIYILQDPTEFVTQLGGNARNRGVFFSDPLGALWSELRLRYFVQIGGLGAGLDPIRALKSVVLVTILGGALGFVLSPGARAQSGARYLGWATLVQAGALAILDGHRVHFYAIHILPWYFLLTALFVLHAWRRGDALARAAVSLWAVAYATIQVAGAAHPIRRDNLHHGYRPAADFLRPFAAEGRMIMGSAELGFELGFKSNLVDDWSLGCHSGKTPDVIVQDTGYRNNQRNRLHAGHPCRSHVERVLDGSGYRPAFEQGDFLILARQSR